MCVCVCKSSMPAGRSAGSLELAPHTGCKEYASTKLEEGQLFRNPPTRTTSEKSFSLRSCRSSSVIFFDFFAGNLENLVGNLEGILRDFF